MRLSILILAIVWTFIERTQSAPNSRQRAAAFKAINNNKHISEDLLLHLKQFVHVNDWKRLEMIFPNTERNRNNFEVRKLLDLIDLHKQDPPKLGFDYDYRDREDTWRIATDKNGDIVKLWLYGMGLQDEDIDLSKLPPNLMYLRLTNNLLSNLDVSQLPRRLKLFGADNNNLSTINLFSPPPTLERFYLDSNQLVKVNLRDVPESLLELSLIDNKLLYVDLSPLSGRPLIRRPLALVTGNHEDLNQTVMMDPILLVLLSGNHKDLELNFEPQITMEQMKIQPILLQKGLNGIEIWI